MYFTPQCLETNFTKTSIKHEVNQNQILSSNLVYFRKIAVIKLIFIDSSSIYNRMLMSNINCGPNCLQNRFQINI